MVYVSKHNVPAWLRDKKFFGPWILNLSRSAFVALSHEIWHWDGCFTRRSAYSSALKSNADWVQILLALTGVRARIRKYITCAGTDNWQVDPGIHDYSGLANSTVSEVRTCEPVYCVTMPLGTVIVRTHPTSVPIVTGQCQNWGKKAEGYIKEIFDA